MFLKILSGAQFGWDFVGLNSQRNVGHGARVNHGKQQHRSFGQTVKITRVIVVFSASNL